jgi:hypothetical protein
MTTGESATGRWIDLRALPIYHFIALGFLMASWILPLTVFGMGIGRHVPTGSVFGFESGSYFYITGLFTLPISVAWACIALARTRNVRLELGPESITIQEYAGRVEHYKTLKVNDVKLVTATSFPASLVFGLFVPLVALVGFSFQFVIPNLRLPAGSPGFAAGLTLLAFCALVVAAWAVFAIRPGLTITFFTPSAKYIIDLPGIDTGADMVSWLRNSATEVAGLAPLANDDWVHTSLPRPGILYSVSVVCIVAGVAGLVVSISNTLLTPFNQALCYLAIMLGTVELVTAKHGSSSTLYSSFRSADMETTDLETWLPTGPVPPFIKFAGVVLSFVFVGFSAGRVADYDVVLLLLAGLFFLAWSIVTCRAPERKVSVRLSDGVIEHVGPGEPRTYFILKLKRDRKPRETFPRLWVLLFFVIAGAIGFLLGLLL